MGNNIKGFAASSETKHAIQMLLNFLVENKEYSAYFDNVGMQFHSEDDKVEYFVIRRTKDGGTE